VDDVTKDVLIRILMLFLGVLLAILATIAITMALENGDYAKMSSRRLAGIRWLGGIFGLAAGLQILDSHKTAPLADLLYLLWLAQVGAGITGGQGFKYFTKPAAPSTNRADMPTGSEK
jgi:hypothetical protein